MSGTVTADEAMDQDLWSKMSAPLILKNRHVKGAATGTTLNKKDRVDRQGNYVPYPNITIVSFVTSNSDQLGDALLSQLPETLQRIAGKYTSPLSSASFHVSLIVGPIRNRLPLDNDAWHHSLHAPCWKKVAEYLKEIVYTPQYLVLDEVVVRDSGAVTARLRWENEIHQDEQEYANRVRSDIRDRAQSAAADGTMMETEDRQWHISLAYGRKDCGAMPANITAEIIEKVEACFYTAGEVRRPRRIPLEPATLCLSPDMLRFVPWDGQVPPRT